MHNVDDKEIHYQDRITLCPRESNLSLVNHYDDDADDIKIPNSIQEIKQIYKEFIKND